MRSGGFAAVVVCLAACGSSGGLQFEVDATADPTATQVAVYVGKGGGHLASIAAAGRVPSRAHAGTFWPLAFDDVEVYELTASRRTATFSFAPGDGADRLTVVAVGLTDDVPTSVATKTLAAVRSDVVEVWQLPLEAVTAGLDPPTGRGVERWGELPTELTCVRAVDRQAQDPALTNVFIGTGGDEDCDGHPRLVKDGELNPAECDDAWHRATTVPSMSTLSCMDDKQITTPMNEQVDVCMIGAPRCTDGKPDERRECSHAVPFCAQSGLCSSCDNGTPAERFACVLDLDPRQVPQLLRFARCEIEVNMATMPPVVCEPAVSIDLPTAWFGGVTSCAAPPLYHPPDPMAGWGSTAEIGGISLELASNVGGVCKLQITASVATGRTIDRAAFPAHGLVALQIDGGRGVIAPVVFEYKPVTACTPSPRFCIVNSTTFANETIQRCIANTAVVD